MFDLEFVFPFVFLRDLRGLCLLSGTENARIPGRMILANLPSRNPLKEPLHEIEDGLFRRLAMLRDHLHIADLEHCRRRVARLRTRRLRGTG